MTLTMVAMSDTHGLHHELEIPPGDVLIHAGDLTRYGTLQEVEEFNEFLATLPHQHKVIIAGNHDFCFEKAPEEARARITNAHYLQDEQVEIDGIVFYGSPWQPEFNNFAFNLPRGDALKEKWDLVPQHTDVLVTHCPPFGRLDWLLSGESLGCEHLLDTLARVSPKLHVFGHIHEAFGQDIFGETALVNAAVLDDAYRLCREAVVLDLQV